MTKVKSLLLGSAGAAVVLTAASAAMAADAPMAAAREPVYRCEDTGFWELPGTDTCLKIGGHMRFVAGFHEDNVDDDYANTGALAPANPTVHLENDTFFMTAYGRFNFDARTQTEYGVLRGFAEFQAQDGNTSTGGPAQLRHAYVQLGNWLFGKTGTIFAGVADHYTTFGAQGMLSDAGPRVVQARYTQPFGNGMSFAIALEDPQRQTVNGGLVGNALAGTLADSRDETPAVTAALSASGDWGGAKIAGWFQEQTYRSNSAFGLNAERESSWAALASLSLNVPTGEGDTFNAQAVYTDGVGGLSNGTGTSFWLRNNSTVESAEFIGGFLSFRHFWAPNLHSSIGVSYGEWEYNETAADRAAGPWGGLTDNEANAFVNLFWNPVNNMDVGIEAWYAERELNNGLDDDALSVAVEITRYF